MFFTAEEVRSFRTLGLSPGLKLLGFKDETELAIEDNVRHSLFIYPDEQVRQPPFCAAHTYLIGNSLIQGVNAHSTHYLK